VRESLLPPNEIEKLRAALDECVANEAKPERGGQKSFGGIFLRHLADKHEAFLELVDFAPVTSIARALFGPMIQQRGFTARVCFPNDPFQEVEWHFHQRLIPDPLPPLMPRPQTIDALLYLDDVTELNGPLCVVPGSHQWIESDLPTHDIADKPDQITLTLPAGSIVLVHGATWHRALPTQPGGGMRRLVIMGYGPSWQKPSIYGTKPENGLTKKVLEDPNTPEELKELLGVGGFM
jgi:hypothetical protein